MSLNPAHGKVYLIQRYVIKFVSDLQQVGFFLPVLRFPLPIKLTSKIWLKYCWKWRHNPNPYSVLITCTLKYVIMSKWNNKMIMWSRIWIKPIQLKTVYFMSLACSKVWICSKLIRNNYVLWEHATNCTEEKNKQRCYERCFLFILVLYFIRQFIEKKIISLIKNNLKKYFPNIR